MKKLTVLLFASLLSATAFAADTKVLSAVLASEHITNSGIDIQKIEVVQVYRCRGCFDIVVSGRGYFGDAYVKVQTMQKDADTIEVKYIEGSK